MPHLSHSDLQGKAQTVEGMIDVAMLGPTLMHERLLWDIRTPKMQADPDQGPDICLSNVWKILSPRHRITTSAFILDSTGCDVYRGTNRIGATYLIP